MNSSARMLHRHFKFTHPELHLSWKPVAPALLTIMMKGTIICLGPETTVLEGALILHSPFLPRVQSTYYPICAIALISFGFIMAEDQSLRPSQHNQSLTWFCSLQALLPVHLPHSYQSGL